MTNFRVVLECIYSTAKNRGLWSALKITILLAKHPLRLLFGRYQGFWYGLLNAGLAVAGLWLGSVAAAKIQPSMSAADLLQAVLLAALALSLIAIAAGHFLLPETHRSQVWLRSFSACLFLGAVAGIAYLVFEPWLVLHGQHAGKATLVAVAGMAVLFAFRDTLAWFLRSALLRDGFDLSLRNNPSLAEEDRWRVAVHEAGHALCYGLCNAVPDDAYVVVETDCLTMLGGGVFIPEPSGCASRTGPMFEWGFITLLAGAAAEKTFFENNGAGCAGDVQAFNYQAGVYLASGFGEDAFDIEPKNADEVEANRRAVVRLRDKYMAIAEAFVQSNRDLCEKLATQIADTGYLGSEEIAAAVGGALAPEGWQLLAWPEDMPIKPHPVRVTSGNT